MANVTRWCRRYWIFFVEKKNRMCHTRTNYTPSCFQKNEERKKWSTYLTSLDWIQLTSLWHEVEGKNSRISVSLKLGIVPQGAGDREQRTNRLTQTHTRHTCGCWGSHIFFSGCCCCCCLPFVCVTRLCQTMPGAMRRNNHANRILFLFQRAREHICVSESEITWKIYCIKIAFGNVIMSNNKRCACGVVTATQTPYTITY